MKNGVLIPKIHVKKKEKEKEVWWYICNHGDSKMTSM